MSDYTTNASVNLNVNGKEAEEQLARLKQRASDYKDAIAKAAKVGDKVELKKLSKALRDTEREIKSIQSATVNVADVLKKLDTATPKELRSTLRQLNNELKNMERGTKAWNEHTEKIRRVKKELESVNNSLKQQQTGWSKMSSWLNKWQTMAVAAFAVVMKVVNSARKAVNAYAEMEQEMANVRKFTGMTATQVEDLNEELKEIDTRTSRQELNKLAQEAGRLGKTSKGDVLGFVRAADQINVALDDLGEGATLTLSKLTGIFGDEKRLGTEKSLLAVGSVINELSQNCSASAPYLAEFASRMGGVGAQAGMSIQQIMGFAAVLDSNNQKVEASATALSQVITRLYQDPAKYAKPAGLEVQQFSKLLREDANAAVIQLLESLNKMGNMDVLSPIFVEMGETGSRAISALSTLAGNIDEVKRQQEVANIAFSEATSISKEFDVQNNTVQAGLEKAKKKLNELSVDLGQKLLPVMKYAISSSSAIVQVLSIVVTWVIRYKEILIPAVAAIGAYWAATKVAVTWNTALNAVTKVGAALQASWTTCVGLSKVAVLALTGKLKEAKVALATLNATMKVSPWGLIAAAVTAVGVAVYRAATKTDEYKEALSEAVKKASGFTAETQKEQRELDILFGKLKGAKEGSEDYNNIKNTIISKYGVYLRGLINEKGEVVNLTDAYNQLTTAIRRSAIERGIATAKETINNKYYENTSEWLNILQANLEIYGASAQEAAELTQKVASAFGSGEPIPQETIDRLTEWSSKKPDPTKATSFSEYIDLLSTNAVIGFPGGKGYYQPNEIVNFMYDASSEHQKALANVDAMADGAAPLRKHDTGTIEMAVQSLEELIKTGADGSALILEAAQQNVVTFQNMTLSEAQKYLTEYKAELGYRNGSNSLNEPVGTKCPKCGKLPCECYKGGNGDTTDDDRFKAEKEWREREEALNRIAYATGEKNHEEYRKRIDEIAVEYYNKLRNHTSASADERLQFETQYYEAQQKQQETFTSLSLENENNRYNELISGIKQRYLDGDIQTTKEYQATIELAELDHLKQIKDIYYQNVNAPMEAWLKAKQEAGSAMKEAFAGNVDLLHRPVIASSKLAEKGWQDVGDGKATVFSSQYGVTDNDGNVHEILVTPILPNGTVLSEKELEDYIFNTLEGKNDILSADSKGIVIAVDVATDGTAGEYLHQLQEKFYSDAPALNAELMKAYSSAVSAYDNALIKDQQRRQEEALDAKKKHQELLAKMKSEYFGDNPAERQAKYNTDLAALTEVYNAELAAAGDNAAERLRIEEAFQRAKLALQVKYGLEGATQNKNALEKANAEFLEWMNSDGGKAVTQSFDTIVSGMSNIFSQVSSLVQAELEIETAAIEKRYDKEISRAEGNTYKVKKLEEQKEKEIAKAKNKANKKMFAMQVIQAVAQTAQNAIAAYGSAAAIPVVGFTLAPIAAGLAVAAGMLQIAAIKKQQQASASQGYASGGFTPQGGKYEPAGIVHKGEWVASRELLASPVARPLIEALDFAQRTNTIGCLRSDDVSRSITAPAIIASANGNNASADAINAQAVALAFYADTIKKLNDRLNEPFFTVNTVTGDDGIKKAQDDYDKLLRNKTPKSKRK